jgi:hypothetical protein
VERAETCSWTVAGTADRIGLTRALSAAMASTRQRRSAHDPGVVLRDLVVMLADGGECLADLGALRDQPDLFGNVASDSTAFRVIDSIDEQGLRSFARCGRCRASAAAAAAVGSSAMEMGEVVVYVIGLDQLADADRERLLTELRRFSGDPEFIEEGEPQFHFLNADETAAQGRVQTIVRGECQKSGIDSAPVWWTTTPADRR